MFVEVSVRSSSLPMHALVATRCRCPTRHCGSELRASCLSLGDALIRSWSGFDFATKRCAFYSAGHPLLLNVPHPDHHSRNHTHTVRADHSILWFSTGLVVKGGAECDRVRSHSFARVAPSFLLTLFLGASISSLRPSLVPGPHSSLVRSPFPGSSFQTPNGRQHVRPDSIASFLPIFIPSSCSTRLP